MSELFLEFPTIKRVDDFEVPGDGKTIIVTD